MRQDMGHRITENDPGAPHVHLDPETAPVAEPEQRAGRDLHDHGDEQHPIQNDIDRPPPHLLAAVAQSLQPYLVEADAAHQATTPDIGRIGDRHGDEN